LVWIENTISAMSGKIFPLDELKKLKDFCQSQEMILHLDGARILNASVASGVSPKIYGSLVDSLSLCFSKGLSAPVGSILLGNAKFINQAKRFRKWYGGAIHQAGILAAAARFSLENYARRLSIDHTNAQAFARMMEYAPGVSLDIRDIETN